jgi:hypothetical protein
MPADRADVISDCGKGLASTDYAEGRKCGVSEAGNAVSNVEERRFSAA